MHSIREHAKILPFGRGKVERSDFDMARVDVSSLPSWAERLYSLLMPAIARGDMHNFEALVAPSALLEFNMCIEERGQQGLRWSAELLDVRSLDYGKRVGAGPKQVTDIRLRAIMRSSLLDKFNRVIAGDPVLPVELYEIWTFEAHSTGPEARWLLSCMEDDE